MMQVSLKTRNNGLKMVRQIRNRKAELLNLFGHTGSQIAIDSMTRVSPQSDQTSQPGQPPFVRSPPPNMQSIQHAVNLSNDTVKFGPLAFGARGQGGRSVPNQLEYGGTVIVRRRGRGARRGSTYRVYIAPRPFIRPAAEKAMERLKADIRRNGLIAR